MRNSILQHDVFYKVFYILLIFSILTILPEVLFASSAPIPATGDIAFTICRVVEQLTGPIGQAISTIAVIFIGVGLFMGKVSWGLALGIAAGMGMLFGATNVVGWVSGSTFTCATS